MSIENTNSLVFKSSHQKQGFAWRTETQASFLVDRARADTVLSRKMQEACKTIDNPSSF